MFLCSGEGQGLLRPIPLLWRTIFGEHAGNDILGRLDFKFSRGKHTWLAIYILYGHRVGISAVSELWPTAMSPGYGNILGVMSARWWLYLYIRFVLERNLCIDDNVSEKITALFKYVYMEGDQTTFITFSPFNFSCFTVLSSTFQFVDFSMYYPVRCGRFSITVGHRWSPYTFV